MTPSRRPRRGLGTRPPALLGLLLAAVALAAPARGARAATSAATSASPSPSVPPSAPSIPAPASPAEIPETRPGRTHGYALPVLFWLPETRLGFGLTGGLHRVPAGARRPSSVFASAVYTLEGQGTLDLAGERYDRDGGLLSARTRLVYFPDSFYGIGPDTAAGDREAFTRRFAELGAAFERAIVPHRLRAGPRVDLRVEDVSDAAPGGTLAAGGLAGASGFAAVGVGAVVTWDSRENAFYPRRGTFAQVAWLGYPAMDGHEGFGKGGAEVRGFLPLGRLVLGGAAFVDVAHGDVPFTLLPRIGSTRFLRGYREGRYRDRAAWAAQAELRAPVAGRVAAAAFGAAGNVGPRLSGLGLGSPKVAGGLGLRWRLSDEGANVRVDVAVGGAGVELYVLVLEAF